MIFYLLKIDALLISLRYIFFIKSYSWVTLRLSIAYICVITTMHNVAPPPCLPIGYTLGGWGTLPNVR